MVVTPKHVDVRGGVCGWTAEDGTPCHQPLAFGHCLGRDGVAHGQRHGLPPMLWSCSCGWTNTAKDLTCQRCGLEAVAGYGI